MGEDQIMTIAAKYKKMIKNSIPRSTKIKIRKALDFVPSNFDNYICNKRYNRLSTIKPGEIIRVGFIAQMPQVWDKQMQLFDALASDERFTPVIIVVPEYDFTNKHVNKEYKDNYFLKNYSDYCVKAYDEGKWIDIRSLKLDYVFYQRPYDWYLPEELKSFNVAPYTKCCYIPYAIWMSKHNLCGYNRAFFRSLYFGFMESKENCDGLIKRGDYKAEKRYLFCGYPSLDLDEPAVSQTKHDKTTVLWTPRWSYDENVGGSHFFEYKDDILALAKDSDDYRVILRPHPLSFQNYVSMGLMTEDEVDAYKKKAVECGASFDSNELIDDTFADTDILITDVSSIIYPFVLFEKPIIFCNTKIPQSPSFEALFGCMYMAENWDDVMMWISEIKKGNDSLKDKRHKFAEKLRTENKGAVERIIRHLEKGE